MAMTLLSSTLNCLSGFGVVSGIAIAAIVLSILLVKFFDDFPVMNE